MERENGGNAAVDRIGEPGLGLVADGDDGVVPPAHWHVVQQLGHVAGPEHFVDRSEPGRPLLRPEVGREHAPGHALPSQELAGPAGGRC